MIRVRFAYRQSHPTEFLDFTSLTSTCFSSQSRSLRRRSKPKWPRGTSWWRLVNRRSGIAAGKRPPTGPPGTPLLPVTDRARQQQCEALSHRFLDHALSLCACATAQRLDSRLIILQTG
jgi:hypothetical protein